jgi:SagB-type dehydrogenase family enzyme
VSKNRDIAAGWRYHNATKHSYASVRTNPHTLDWNNLPLLFKIYPTLEVTRLPREARQTGVAALSAISAPPIPGQTKAIPNLDDLAQLLFLSAGITKSKKHPGGETFFRAAACTGALYEIELYLVTGDLPELPAGVYHFGVAEFGLRQLRAGDYRRVVAEATAKDPAVLHAPLTIICTGTYWRNAWKYQARTYRHFGWDNGTMLANMLAASNAMKLPAKVITAFLDEPVTRLLELDTQREVAFSLVPIGYRSDKIAAPPPINPLGLPLLPLSKTEIDYPLMREMHAASCLDSDKEIVAWRKQSPRMLATETTNKIIPLQPLSDKQLPKDPLEQVILRRGSSRRFVQKPITFPQLSTILRSSTVGVPADFVNNFGSQLNDLYLIANDVEGLTPGAYVYHRERQSLELLRHGNFRKLAGYLGLEQQLPADASVDIFFLADLNAILARLGNRGYRAVQLEAGMIGGKLYLAAYAQHLGATGLTFYDDDVVRFFSPHAEKKSAIFLVAIGKSS